MTVGENGKDTVARCRELSMYGAFLKLYLYEKSVSFLNFNVLLARITTNSLLATIDQKIPHVSRTQYAKNIKFSLYTKKFYQLSTK